MLLFVPLLFPIARQIGVNEVHYAEVHYAIVIIFRWASAFSRRPSA